MQENPYQSPLTSGTPPQYAAANYEYAGFWLRFVAALIDGIIINVFAFIIGFVLGFVLGFVWAMGGNDVQSPEFNRFATLFGNLIGILIAWLYYALMESSSNRATLGKMALGLQVVDEDGRRISFGRATGRHFAKILSAIILLIGYIMAGLTERKQALHDMVAGCLVIRRP